MTITFKVSEKTKNKMIEYYKDLKKEVKVDYYLFQAKENKVTITLYKSGKVVFQGRNSDIISNKWYMLENNISITDSLLSQKEEIDYMNCNSIGSDEAGCGDYFGPIVVTATYVKKEDIPYLKSINVKDSKKLSDLEIVKIVPKIINVIKYKSTICYNKDYNDIYNKNINMNKIKAMMHNQVLYELNKEVNDVVDYIIVDKFVNSNKYYEYLNDNKFIQKDITFIAKAEDKNLAVACSSIISRYIFLKEFNSIEKEIGINIPKGANKDITKSINEIVNKFGKNKLKEIAKINFRNSKKRM